MKPTALIFLSLTVLFAGSASAAQVTACSATVTPNPVVSRLGKDEFRVAFGIGGEECRGIGCAGTIDYRTIWEDEKGVRNVDVKRVGYSIPAGAAQSITVDRSYFDTAEGKHTTQVVDVRIDKVSCALGVDAELAAR